MGKVLLCTKHWDVVCTDDPNDKAEALRTLGYSSGEIREVIHAKPVRLEPEGEYPMAKKSKKTTKTVSKKTPKEGGGGGRGKTLGLKVGETWAHFFTKNEKAGKGSKMTDEQIQREMRREFPDRSGKNEFSNVAVVNRIRYLYNSGKWGKPPAQSSKYDDSGNVVLRGTRESTKAPKAKTAKGGKQQKGEGGGKAASKGKPASASKKSFLKKGG